MPAFSDYLSRAATGETLSEADMADCIGLLMDGSVDEEDAAQFLITLADRGETADEIAGAAKALRSRASTINAPVDAIDCCGTGGDGASTYNISTAVALVCAGAGLKIAKHGNRSASSKSGAADVLEQLGVNLSLSTDTLEKSLRDIGFCFLMAPNHHAAMKHVAPVRKKLGRRTIFNLLGPLANPAGTTKQLVGVYAEKFVEPMAQALQSLGASAAMVVHGEDGLDEISLAGKTHVALLKNGGIIKTAFMPADFDLGMVSKEEIAGGDAVYNASALMALLKGAHTPYRSIVLANAAAVLMLHDGRTLRDGVRDAADVIDSGKALSVLTRYKELTP